MSTRLLGHLERIAERGIDPSLDQIISEHGKRFNTSPKVRVPILIEYTKRVSHTGSKEAKARLMRVLANPAVVATLEFYNRFDKMIK